MRQKLLCRSPRLALLWVSHIIAYLRASFSRVRRHHLPPANNATSLCARPSAADPHPISSSERPQGESICHAIPVAITTKRTVNHRYRPPAGPLGHPADLTSRPLDHLADFTSTHLDQIAASLRPPQTDVKRRLGRASDHRAFRSTCWKTRLVTTST